MHKEYRIAIIRLLTTGLVHDYISGKSYILPIGGYNWQNMYNLVNHMKLLIRNLARTTTEAELKALFDEFGTVQSCTVVMDKVSGGSKGFGFVEIPKAGEAKAAMKSLNGKELAGNKIRVKKAEESE